LAGCTPGAASTKSTDELLDYVTEKPRPKPLGRLEIAFLMASEVGRFLNILGRLCRGLVRKAFCTLLNLALKKIGHFWHREHQRKRGPLRAPQPTFQACDLFPRQKKPPRLRGRRLLPELPNERLRGASGSGDREDPSKNIL